MRYLNRFRKHVIVFCEEKFIEHFLNFFRSLQCQYHGTEIQSCNFKVSDTGMFRMEDFAVSW